MRCALRRRSAGGGGRRARGSALNPLTPPPSARLWRRRSWELVLDERLLAFASHPLPSRGTAVSRRAESLEINALHLFRPFPFYYHILLNQSIHPARQKKRKKQKQCRKTPSLAMRRNTIGPQSVRQAQTRPRAAKRMRLRRARDSRAGTACPSLEAPIHTSDSDATTKPGNWCMISRPASRGNLADRCCDHHQLWRQ